MTNYLNDYFNNRSTEKYLSRENIAEMLSALSRCAQRLLGRNIHVRELKIRSL